MQDFPRSWRRLIAADVAWKAFAFALLTPGTMLLLRIFLSRHSDGVIADAEIARTLLTTVPGIVSLVLGAPSSPRSPRLEVTGLMAIGFAGADGKAQAGQALLFAVTHAPGVLGLTAHMVVRVLAGLLPFGLAAGGLVYFALLRHHDINYYLARRPAEFWVAALLVAALVAALLALLVRTVARWAFALPIVLFEDVAPRRALGESRRRSEGDRDVILFALARRGGRSRPWSSRLPPESPRQPAAASRRTSAARWPELSRSSWSSRSSRDSSPSRRAS